MSTVWNIRFPNISMSHQLNAEEQKELDQAKSPFRKASIAAVIGLITSVALAIIGIAMIGSGVHSAGIPLLIVSLPIGYLSYNIYKVSDNIIDALDTMPEYRRHGKADLQKLKVKFKQGTFCFGYAIDYLVAKMTSDEAANN